MEPTQPRAPQPSGQGAGDTGARFAPTSLAVPVGQSQMAVDPEITSASVARALTALGALSGLSLDEHPDAYRQIHAELQSALAEIDNA